MSNSSGLLNVGVMASDHISVGVVGQEQVRGPIRVMEELSSTPGDRLAEVIYREIEAVCADTGVDVRAISSIGIGFPGIIRDGIIEESPNIKQVKGLNLAASMTAVLSGANSRIPVLVINDADAMAAGVAAAHKSLDKLVRVWTLGNGIGYGRFPRMEGAGECGHLVVSLDPKEQYCGCGGTGHLEGIMGYRAMRLRFLDMEPEEVFASARLGDAKCVAFVRMWHRALAAATANVVHLDAMGKFYITGPNAVYVDTTLLHQYLNEMVKMTPLQGSVFEVVPTSEEVGVIGAAISARVAAG